MAVPTHHLLTWSGIFGSSTSPIEQWQFSLKAPYTPALSDSTFDALAQGMSTCYSTNFVDRYKPDVVLTGCTIVQVDGAGKFATNPDGSYRRGEWTGSIPGTQSAGERLPLSTALAISLVTARPGPTGKGRFFMPFPAYFLDAGYRLSSIDTTDWTNRAAEFIRDVNLIDRPVGVFSSKGYSSPVTAVKVGRVPDTMRSRRGDMLESYVTVPL